MQAQKAFDSPRRIKRGTAADLSSRLSRGWPRVGTASPPKRDPILTPHLETYKGGIPRASTSRLPFPDQPFVSDRDFALQKITFPSCKLKRSRGGAERNCLNRFPVPPPPPPYIFKTLQVINSLTGEWPRSGPPARLPSRRRGSLRRCKIDLPLSELRARSGWRTTRFVSDYGSHEREAPNRRRKRRLLHQSGH